MYDRTSGLNNINTARKAIFTRKSRKLKIFHPLRQLYMNIPNGPVFKVKFGPKPLTLCRGYQILETVARSRTKMNGSHVGQHYHRHHSHVTS